MLLTSLPVLLMQAYGHHLIPLSKFRFRALTLAFSSRDRILKVITKAYGHGTVYRTIQGTPWSGLAKVMGGWNSASCSEGWNP
ncbi:MAG: hypothetical protein JNL29_13275 [Nitrospira sp.]|nr:hypothetical protein [Nitrospira sp.]